MHFQQTEKLNLSPTKNQGKPGRSGGLNDLGNSGGEGFYSGTRNPGRRVSRTLATCRGGGGGGFFLECVVPENIHTPPTEGFLFCTPTPP